MVTDVAPKTPSGAVKPEFLRFPGKGGREPYTGLSRSTLYALADAGRIQTFSVRARGAGRGARLIVFDSLMACIRGESA